MPHNVSEGPAWLAPQCRTTFLTLEKASYQANLFIHFIIIGGGIAGLACAIALRRVGHRVTVLEKESTLRWAPGGCRLTPNVTKIFYNWGLKERLLSVATKSESVGLLVYDTGEHLGEHVWDEEILRETRGDFVFVNHPVLRKLLHDFAVDQGATVSLGATVVSFDAVKGSVTLESGNTIEGDVIIGADGPNGLSRRIFLKGEKDVTEAPRLNMFSTIIPKQSMLNDPETAYFYNEGRNTMWNWFGSDYTVLGFPIGSEGDWAMFTYGPTDGEEGGWGSLEDASGLEHVLEPAEPRLKKISRLASNVSRVTVRNYIELEDWVHDDGRMAVIGQAAHPLPPGAVQSCAMTVEDGAVLAKLFSHLRDASQIRSFLWAFQDLRQTRCSSVRLKEMGTLFYMTMPEGPEQRARNDAMRAKRDAGVNILQASEGFEENPAWVEIKEVFAYDAEDEADNWWVEWGMLRERSKGIVPSELDAQPRIQSFQTTRVGAEPLLLHFGHDYRGPGAYPLPR